VFEQSYFSYAITFCGSLLLTLILTPVMRIIALRYHVMDHPISPIKTHTDPVPYLGGIAIFIGTIVPLLIARFITDFPTGTLRALRAILVGGTCIMLMGLIDDIYKKGLNFRVKFFIQFLVSGLLILFNVRIQFVQMDWMADFITILWVVGITNAMNLLDIMDGLAASIAVIASFAFLFIALPTEAIYVNLAAAALCGSCLGFLPFNTSKHQRIFMGDAGSLFIGFFLAALSLGTSYTRVNDIGLFAPILILGLPIFETLLVSSWRIKKGRSPFKGSKDHFALRLRAMNFSQKQILAITIGLSILLAIGAFGITRLSLGLAGIIFIAILMFGFIFTFWIAKAPIE